MDTKTDNTRDCLKIVSKIKSLSATIKSACLITTVQYIKVFRTLINSSLTYVKFVRDTKCTTDSSFFKIAALKIIQFSFSFPTNFNKFSLHASKSSALNFYASNPEKFPSLEKVFSRVHLPICNLMKRKIPRIYFFFAKINHVARSAI